MLLPGQPPVTETVELSSEGLPPALVNRGALTSSFIDTEIIGRGLRGQFMNGVIQTELVSLHLRGQSSLGEVNVKAGAQFNLNPSLGQINKIVTDANGNLTSAQSFFDVFAQVEVFMRSALPPIMGPGDTGAPPQIAVIAQNEVLLHLETTIYKLPPNYPDGEPKKARAIDHFKCYDVKRKKFSISATLSDQFETHKAKVMRPVSLCNPVSKNNEGFRNTKRHLVCYAISPTKRGFKPTAIGIHNQFGDETVDVLARETLCVPSTKSVRKGPSRSMPKGNKKPLDHYKCYTITSRNPLQSRSVKLVDQFESRQARTSPPSAVCNPVKKVVKRKVRGKRVTEIAKIKNAAAHLVTYPIAPRKPFKQRIVEVKNQFGTQRLVVVERRSLMVPTHKTPCSEYAERTKTALMAAGNHVGTINMAIHVPFEGRPDASCP